MHGEGVGIVEIGGEEERGGRVESSDAIAGELLDTDARDDEDGVVLSAVEMKEGKEKKGCLWKGVMML